MIRSKATAALMRLKEIDKKYKSRYDDHREKDRSSENTESLIDSYNPPKSNDNLDPSIPAEQTTQKSTLNIKIPDACCQLFETRSSTSDTNVSVRVTAVDNVSGLIAVKTQFSEEISEKSEFTNQNPQSPIPENKIPKDTEPAETINKTKNTDSHAESEKSRSATEIDEILDDDESISEILDRSLSSKSLNSEKSKTDQIAVGTKDSLTKNDEPLNRHSFSDEETLKSDGYSKDSFESVVSEKESSTQSQTQKSTPRSPAANSDSETDEKSSSFSRIEPPSTKSDEKLNKKTLTSNNDGEISNLFVPLTAGDEKIQVGNKIHETPRPSRKEDAVLGKGDRDRSTGKEEPLEIYEESGDEELSSAKNSLGSINNESSLEKHSKTLGNCKTFVPAAHEESSTSLKSLDSAKSSSEPCCKKLSIARIPNGLQNKNDDKKTIVSRANHEDSRNSLRCTKSLRKYKKEEFKISAISQNKIAAKTVRSKQKMHRRDELPMELEKKCCQLQSHSEIDTKKDELFPDNKKTSRGKKRLPLPKQLRRDRHAATTQSARASRPRVACPGKIEFQDRHHRELQSLEEQFGNLRMEQDRETMLFYMRNFEEDQKRLLLWPSQLQASRKPEIAIIKPLDFPEVANFNEPDITMTKSALCTDVHGELLKNRILEIRGWLKNQFILYRDYCDVAAAINAKYAEKQQCMKFGTILARRQAFKHGWGHSDPV